MGYHCLSHSHGHLLCRVTHREERKPPEYKSDWAVETRGGAGMIERERERLQALVRELETVN